MQHPCDTSQDKNYNQGVGPWNQAGWGSDLHSVTGQLCEFGVYKLFGLSLFIYKTDKNGIFPAGLLKLYKLLIMKCLQKPLVLSEYYKVFIK